MQVLPRKLRTSGMRRLAPVATHKTCAATLRHSGNCFEAHVAVDNLRSSGDNCILRLLRNYDLLLSCVGVLTFDIVTVR